MAAHSPSIIHDENLHIHRGNPQKKTKAPREGRKALADLSNAPPRKPPLSSSKAAAIGGLRDKSLGPRGGVSSKKTKKESALTEEEVGRCREWAKEGIERIHFTGNDARKAETEIQEERVRKEVEMVMSSLKERMPMPSDSSFQEASGDPEDVARLEVEPEDDLPLLKSSFSSGNEDDDPSLGNELQMLPDEEVLIELKLKDDDVLP